MNQSRALYLRLLPLFFLLTLGCSTVFSQEPVSTPISWPQAHFETPEQVTPVSVGGQTQYVSSAQVTDIAMLRGGRQPDLAEFPPVLTFIPAQKPVLPIQQPVQIDTYHASPYNITAVEFAINDQPIVPDEEQFPTSHVKVEICSSYEWLQTGVASYRQFCSTSGLKVASRYEPPPGFIINEQTVSLVITGRVPGLYKLTSTTIDGAGNRREVDQLLEFAGSQP